MEYQKIRHLLGNTSDEVHRFITKKWVEVHDQSGGKYNTIKQIKLKAPILRSGLCDYDDAYIFVTGKTTLESPDNNAYDKKLVFKNNGPFINCVGKINNYKISITGQLENDDEEKEDIKIVVP